MTLEGLNRSALAIRREAFTTVTCVYESFLMYDEKWNLWGHASCAPR